MKKVEEYLDEYHFHKSIRNTLSYTMSPDGVDGSMYERLVTAMVNMQQDAYKEGMNSVLDELKK